MLEYCFLSDARFIKRSVQTAGMDGKAERAALRMPERQDMIMGKKKEKQKEKKEKLIREEEKPAKKAKGKKSAKTDRAEKNGKSARKEKGGKKEKAEKKRSIHAEKSRTEVQKETRAELPEKRAEILPPSGDPGREEMQSLLSGDPGREEKQPLSSADPGSQGMSFPDPEKKEASQKPSDVSAGRERGRESAGPMASDTDMDMAAVFRALGDESRMQILGLLKEHGEMNGTELLSLVKVVQSTLSHHMKVLTESGLVLCRRQGKWSWYSICGERLGQAADFLRLYQKKCGESEDRI